MATIIQQAPLYPTLPVGQEMIFTVSNNIIVANKTRVKFIAEVHISQVTPPNLSVATDRVGTFKTTPNNAGRGMFDLSSVVESFVTTDNIGDGAISQYKLLAVNSVRIPLHLINKFSFNDNIIRYLRIQFKVEYLDDNPLSLTYNQIIVQQAVNSDLYRIFNGYLKHTDKLKEFTLPPYGFGYDLGIFQLSSPNDRFLTNASKTQYANIEDYGTIAFLDPTLNVEYIKFSYLDDAGGSLGSDDIYTALNVSSNLRQEILYLGCYPGNLRNWSGLFQGLVTAGTINSYTVQAFDDNDDEMSKEYTINVNCPTLKGYVPIRLAWLNQWGAWDYYTFTQKSVRSLSTKGSTYTQSSGTWNKYKYRINGYKGGQKSFRVNATEKIKMNTDFVNESESEWFEELINSPEVYILEGYQSDSINALLNTYVTPVRLTTSSHIRKTRANDKLIQYTFEVEKSKTLRTQAV
jgi:hypothetical protein